VEKSNKKAGRNIKVSVDESLPTGVTEEQNKIMEKYIKPRYLIMLETIGSEKGLLWKLEIYQEWEIEELGFTTKELLAKKFARWWNGEDDREK
jgi:hypothetical protein